MSKHGRGNAQSGGARLARLVLVLAAIVAFAIGVPAIAGIGTPAATGSGSITGEREVVLITGSTSGLGETVARRMAARGAHVIIHGRSEERGLALVREIQAEGVGSASFHAADLASLDDVRALARTILAEYDRLDVLVNNAGIGSARDGREVSHDGYELRLHVNYLSHFLLTHELLPLIVRSAPARIVNVASGSQSPIDFDDIMLEQPGAISRAYGQSKLAQILHAFDLARELEGKDVIVSALHPATYMDTGMILNAGLTPRSSVEEGADAVMQLIVGSIESGQYFNGLVPRRANAQAYDETVRARLRQVSRQLVGLDP
jgi:NAD(P)-dependent dehydrogenase (short-subunit alcohol dehydrogenase family)